MILATQSKRSPYYESIEFTLSTGQTDYDLDVQQSTFLSVLGPGNATDSHPSEVIIRTDQTITVKFNLSTNHSITVTASDSPLIYSGEIRNVFLTNSSGNTANIKILVLP